jgi:O-antigen/teichoic acid export membrane protein
MVVAVSVALAVAAAAVAEAIGGGSRVARDIQLALPLLPVSALTLALAGGLQGLHRVTSSLTASLLAPRVAFLAGLGGVLLAAGELGSDAAVLLQVGSGLAGLMLAVVLLARAVPPEARAAPRRPAPAGWLRASLPLGLATGLTIATWNVSTLAAATLGSAEEAGLYAAAAQVSIPLVILFEAVRTPFAPMVAQLWAGSERARLQRGVTGATRRVFLGTAVAAAAAAIFAEPLLGLFGEGFESGAPALRYVVLAQLLNAAAAFNGLVLMMTGHEAAVARAALISFVVTVVALPLLVPPLGAEGAALALLAGTVVRNVVNTVQALRLTGLDTTVAGAWSRA